MLKTKQIIFHVKRFAMSNIYISPNEGMDLLDNLNTSEAKLYMLLKASVLKADDPSYFDNASLAYELGLSVSSLKNAKSGLKKKGYALIVPLKDEHNSPMVRVILGKDQVTLYNLGLKVEITNAKAYNKLLKLFPIDDPSLAQTEREELCTQLNEYYEKNIQDFK